MLGSHELLAKVDQLKRAGLVADEALGLPVRRVMKSVATTERQDPPTLREIVHRFALRDEAAHRHLTHDETVALTLASANGVDRFDLLRSFRIIRTCSTCSLMYANHKDSSKPAPGTVAGVDAEDC